MTADLPFECPHCGERFGFGGGAGLIGVVTSLPFGDQMTPCCGGLITGYLLRDGGTVRMELTQ